MSEGAAGIRDWLAELIAIDSAEKSTAEFVIGLEDGRLALIVPEESAVYLITVEPAQFVAAGGEAR